MVINELHVCGVSGWRAFVGKAVGGAACGDDCKVWPGAISQCLVSAGCCNNAGLQTGGAVSPGALNVILVA